MAFMTAVTAPTSIAASSLTRATNSGGHLVVPSCKPSVEAAVLVLELHLYDLRLRALRFHLAAILSAR